MKNEKKKEKERPYHQVRDIERNCKQCGCAFRGYECYHCGHDNGDPWRNE